MGSISCHAIGTPALAGIDWGGARHLVCVLDLAGTKLREARLNHNVPGPAAPGPRARMLRRRSADRGCVETLMSRGGIIGVHLRKKVRTTVPATDQIPVADLIQRDFTAPKPNQKYVGDITYLPIGDGRFLYLATVLDLNYEQRSTTLAPAA